MLKGRGPGRKKNRPAEEACSSMTAYKNFVLKFQVIVYLRIIFLSSGVYFIGQDNSQLGLGYLPVNYTWPTLLQMPS